MFRLLSIKFERHKVLGDLDLQFVDDRDSSRGPYTTLIIGQNGSGKSHLLRAVIEVFREIESIVNTGKLRNLFRGGFSVRYCVDNDVYIVNTIAAPGLMKMVGRKQFLKNGELIEAKALKLPTRVIATSIMLNDRFPVLKETDQEIYHYLGIRRTPSTAGTKSYLKKTVFALLNNFEDENLGGRMKDILSFLGYQYSLEVCFYPRYKPKFLDGRLTAARFHSSFSEWDEASKRATIPFSVSTYKKIKSDHDLIAQLVSLLNKISSRLKTLDGSSRATYFVYDVFTNELTVQELRNLELVFKLDILSEPSLLLRKQANEFPIGESSSGEYHVLVSMIGILAGIRPQSLILIDEPEISLHPSWQMRYVNFLKQTFKGFPDCHFLISSHSHFLVSDLVSDSSALVHMTANGNIRGEFKAGNTYGWSAEQVLLDVFGVPTTRNYYLAERIGAILDLIARRDRPESQIQEKVEELEALNLQNLSVDDPLKDVVDKLLKRYSK